MNKKVLIIIISIVVAIAIAVGSIIIVKNNSIAGSEINKGNAQKEDDTWDDWELSIDRTSLKLPMKYSEFINKGFYINESSLAYNLEYGELDAETSVGLNTSLYGNTTYSNGTTSGITLVVYNPSSEKIKIKDSYIVGIEFVYGNNYTRGEIKLINNTRKTEVKVGKSTISEIKTAFGPHYERDNLNTFHYYPDLDKDGTISRNDLNMKRFISLYCDSENEILNIYDFMYCDFGSDNYNWNMDTSNDNLNWNIPTNFSYLKTDRFGTEQVYDNEQYRVHLLTYWKFDSDFKEITNFLNNKENYNGKGSIVENSKYGKIFVLELDEYNYEDRYSYYVITEDGKYFMHIVSKATPNTTYQEAGLNIVEWKSFCKKASRMSIDDVTKLALEFLP